MAPGKSNSDAGTSAAGAWAARPAARRAKVVGALRHVLAAEAERFIEVMRMPFRSSAAETLAAELIPLADACRFIERNAAALLRPRRLGRWGRPIWLSGVEAEIRREPLGTVLVIAPVNYPLMLPGIQVAQALAAGNRVLLKPAPGTAGAAGLLCEALHRLGVPKEALILLDESPDALPPWLDVADQVVLTGSAETGRTVLAQLAPRLMPAVMELSGCDAAFVLPGADLTRAAAALRFGLTFNGSATCMAPRRAFVHEVIADALARRLAEMRSTGAALDRPATGERLNALAGEALAGGAALLVGRVPYDPAAGPIILDHARPPMRLLQEDVMAPVLSLVRVASEAAALEAYERCPYRLGASVFGPVDAARDLAGRIDAGSVVINDVIIPGADPRLPLAPRGQSGFGVTRGAEGLLAMTRVKTIAIRRGGSLMHLRPGSDLAGPFLRAFLSASHGRGAIARLRGWAAALREAKRLATNDAAMEDE